MTTLYYIIYNSYIYMMKNDNLWKKTTHPPPPTSRHSTAAGPGPQDARSTRTRPRIVQVPRYTLTCETLLTQSLPLHTQTNQHKRAMRWWWCEEGESDYLRPRRHKYIATAQKSIDRTGKRARVSRLHSQPPAIGGTLYYVYRYTIYICIGICIHTYITIHIYT